MVDKNNKHEIITNILSRISLQKKFSGYDKKNLHLSGNVSKNTEKKLLTTDKKMNVV